MYFIIDRSFKKFNFNFSDLEVFHIFSDGILFLILYFVLFIFYRRLIVIMIGRN